MAKKQIYSLKFIRQNYTYSVYEIAEIYNLTPDTVFRWIRYEGLLRITSSKKYFIHSSELLKFLKQRNGKNKKPCEYGEIYCCKCRLPRNPKPSSLTNKKCPNETIRISAKCGTCDTHIFTIVSSKKWSKTHPFHPDKNTAIKRHSGEHKTPHKCQTQEGEQLCLNITQ